MDSIATNFSASDAQLDRARAFLHTNPCVDIGLNVFRAVLCGQQEGVDDTAAALALTELEDYRHYEPEILLKAIVQCRKTIGEGGAGNLQAALQELIATFALR
jgi:hypothetical protein